jgi:hypothetical protein
MQQLSMHDHRPTILFGANLITALGEFGADYQIVHQPFQPFKPFRSTLNLTARLQLGRYSTNLGTYVRPDGSIDYSASGSTFLYMGAFGGVQPQQLGQSLGRYVVRGVVRDEDGQPVDGAAVELSGEMAFTNSRGEFFVRVRRPQRYALTIPLDDFLLPGRWEVVTAPSEAIAESEDRAQAVEIILKRVRPAAPAPAPTPPAAAPTSPAMPADTGVWHTADTLHRVSAAAAPAELPTLVVRFEAWRLVSGGGSRPRMANTWVESVGWGRECGLHHGRLAPMPLGAAGRTDPPVTLSAAKGPCVSSWPLHSVQGDTGSD